MLKPDMLEDLMTEYGCAEAIFDRFIRSGPGFLSDRCIPEPAIDILRQRASSDCMHEMMQTMHRLNIGIMYRNDNIYPDALRHIPQPPTFLYYRGNPDCLLGKCVAIVGSRTASPKGLAVTHQISRELSEAGVTIVSGLAMGIDASAHEGCLQGGSPTAAILACGMDVDYPAENLDLREQIVSSGGVLLSEYPLGMRSGKHVFQMRNRIISGLCKAVLMMEGRIRSGSMITVHHALDQGRDVFAYPGVPDSEWAEGAHQLLREGAIYFTSAQDVLEDLDWASDLPTPTMKQRSELPAMTEEQRRVYVLLGRGEMSFDELAAESGLPVPTLSVALTMLQMMGVIRAMPGKTYCRN
nr:DNA-processing protein DprA [Clostridia bacterium]